MVIVVAIVISVVSICSDEEKIMIPEDSSGQCWWEYCTTGMNSGAGKICSNTNSQTDHFVIILLVLMCSI